LMVMIKGIAVGMRSVIAACILLFFITYIFAIVFRQMTAGSRVGGRSFSSVPQSIVTLFIEIIFAGEGLTLTTLTSETGWHAGLLFVIFIFLTSLTIVNMLIGVICDVMTTAAQERKEQASKDEMVDSLQSTLEAADKNFDGRVDRSELESILEDEDAIKALHDHGVDVHALVDDADFIFDACPEGGLSFDEFVDVLARYRANAAATISAVSGLRTFLRLNMSAIHDRLLSIEGGLASSLGGDERESVGGLQEL